MGAERDKWVIGEFIKWFERNYPRERYTLVDGKPEGAYIIRQNGTVITYRDYYAHESLGLTWRNHNDKQN